MLTKVFHSDDEEDTAAGPSSRPDKRRVKFTD
jgi:hypothetical protein